MSIEIQRRPCRIRIELESVSPEATAEALQGVIQLLEARRESLKAAFKRAHVACPSAQTMDLTRLSLSPSDLPLCEAIVNKGNIENLNLIAVFLREHGEALLQIEDGRALVAAMIEKIFCNGGIFLLSESNQDFACEFLFRNALQLHGTANAEGKQQVLRSLIAIVASDEEGRCPLPYEKRRTAGRLIQFCASC